MPKERGKFSARKINQSQEHTLRLAGIEITAQRKKIMRFSAMLLLKRKKINDLINFYSGSNFKVAKAVVMIAKPDFKITTQAGLEILWKNKSVALMELVYQKATPALPLVLSFLNHPSSTLRIGAINAVAQYALEDKSCWGSKQSNIFITRKTAIYMNPFFYSATIC
mgnify:CR=1 FL=1